MASSPRGCRLESIPLIVEWAQRAAGHNRLTNHVHENIGPDFRMREPECDPGPGCLPDVENADLTRQGGAQKVIYVG